MSEISGIDKQPWDELETIYISCNEIITSTNRVPALLRSLSNYDLSNNNLKEVASLSDKLTKAIALGISKLGTIRKQHDIFLSNNPNEISGSVTPSGLVDSVKIVDEYSKWIEKEGNDINGYLVDFMGYFETLIDDLESKVETK